MVKKKRHTADEIAAKLQEAAALAAAGRTQSEIAQALGISVMTFHRWRKAQPQGMAPSAGAAAGGPTPAGDGSAQRRNRVAQLQLENVRLRKIVTDLLLEKMTLEEEAQRAAMTRGRR